MILPSVMSLKVGFRDVCGKALIYKGLRRFVGRCNGLRPLAPEIVAFGLSRINILVGLATWKSILLMLGDFTICTATFGNGAKMLAAIRRSVY